MLPGALNAGEARFTAIPYARAAISIEMAADTLFEPSNAAEIAIGFSTRGIVTVEIV